MGEFTESLIKNRANRHRDYLKIDEQQSQKTMMAALKQYSNAVDDLYFYEKLKLYCQWLSLDKIFAQQEDLSAFRLVRESVDLLAAKDFGALSGFEIYFQIKNILESLDDFEGNQPRFIRLEQLITQYKEEFDTEERVEIYSFCTNICAHWKNLGHRTYVSQHFKYNALMIAEKYDRTGKDKKLLSGQVYKNMVTLCLALSESAVIQEIRLKKAKPTAPNTIFNDKYEWAEAFIQGYKNQLFEKDKVVFHSYSLAKLRYKQGRFEEALKALKDSENKRKELFLNLSLKLLKLQTLYELYSNLYRKTQRVKKDKQREYELFTDIMRTNEKLRSHIKDKKKGVDLQQYIQIYEDFHKFYPQLLTFLETFSNFSQHDLTQFKEERSSLLEELEKIEPVLQNWFRAKIMDIK